jgi:Protein of unknown function (DUF2723)
MTHFASSLIRWRLPAQLRHWRSVSLKTVDLRTPLAFGLPFLLYVITLAPTIYNLDSAELTTAAATGGIVRATGYPLYLLLGRVWSWLPVGDVGFRLNLFSAFCGALTIALAERILRRMQVSAWARFAALGLLACAPFFWAMSLIAEVYMLHTALMAGIILLLLRWSELPTPRRLALVGLAMGLSLGHHAATVLLVPGCAWYVLSVAPRRALAPRALLPAIGALLLGVSVYLYLPLLTLAQPAFNYAGHYNAAGQLVPDDLRSIEGLWKLMTGRAFARQMLAYQGAELWHEISSFAIQLSQAFFIVGVGPGLIGLVVLLRRNWRWGGMLLLMFAFTAGFYIDYRVIDKNTMFLPAFLVWALWLAVGYDWLCQWLGRARDSFTRAWGTKLLQVVVVGVVLIAVAWNWRLTNLSHDRSARLRGESILQVAESNALILGWWDTVPVIEYLQLVEGQRPDVQAINRFLIASDDVRELIEHNIGQRPIYIDSVPDDLSGLARVRRKGLMYELQPRN